MKKSIISLLMVFIISIIIQVSPVNAGSDVFGVMVSGGGGIPNVTNILKDLGAKWIRLNYHLGSKSADIAKFLDAGFDIVITFNNNDVSNMITTYGTPKEFVNAGFPFSSKDVYQQRIRDVLMPLLPYIKNGRKIMAQCENEIGDASLNKKARFWRGTTEQYLIQLEAFYDAVKSVDKSIPVVLSSFTSEGLSKVIDSSLKDEKASFSYKVITTLLEKGEYDVADLHFYGCVNDIPTKIRWVKEHMPQQKPWISTENGGPDYRCSATPNPYDKDPQGYERLQAEQVSERLCACSDNGGSVCLWFSLIDVAGEVDTFSHLGLIEFSKSDLKEGRKVKLRKLIRKIKSGEISEAEKEKLVNAARKKPAYEAFKTFVATH